MCTGATCARTHMRRYLAITAFLFCIFILADFYGGNYTEQEITIISATMRRNDGYCTVYDGSNRGIQIPVSRWNEVKIGGKLKISRRTGWITGLVYE